MVNLELYRVFYTVAKCGSLTKAAEELYISQPAVSQAIKQLETQLGGKLFNRTHKGMELSDTGGKQIFSIVEKALKLFDEAEGHIQRGGSPQMFDRVLAARFGYKAVELLRDDKESCAIGIRDNKVITVPFEEVSTAEKKFDKRLYDIAHVLSL